MLLVCCFRSSAYKCRSGDTNELLPSIVSGEILSSYCEGLKNFWCTPTVGWLYGKCMYIVEREKRCDIVAIPPTPVRRGVLFLHSSGMSAGMFSSRMKPVHGQRSVFRGNM